jgi:hypothetical protein
MVPPGSKDRIAPESLVIVTLSITPVSHGSFLGFTVSTLGTKASGLSSNTVWPTLTVVVGLAAVAPIRD